VISKELLDMLACPACGGGIFQGNEIVECDKCERIYPVKDDVPIMLVEESKCKNNDNLSTIE